MEPCQTTPRRRGTRQSCVSARCEWWLRPSTTRAVSAWDKERIAKLEEVRELRRATVFGSSRSNAQPRRYRGSHSYWGHRLAWAVLFDQSGDDLSSSSFTIPLTLLPASVVRAARRHLVQRVPRAGATLEAQCVT